MRKNNSFIVESMTFRQNEEQFNIFLKNLTPDSFLKFIISINKNLRNTHLNENVLYDGMIADIVAPTEEVRNKVLIDLVNYIKKSNDLKEIATITYYMIIDLHMFSDGNGRTNYIDNLVVEKNVDKSNIIESNYRTIFLENLTI